MAKNLTPEHMRCWPELCPSVHELPNGQILLVARIARPGEVPDDVRYDLTTEIPVVFDPALIANVPRPADREDYLAPFRRCVARDIL